MLRGFLAATTFVAACVSGRAADPELLQFLFKAGDVLTYSVKQTTRVSETAYDEAAKELRTGDTATQLSVTRTWTVKDVDAAGVATLDMAITAMRTEIARPGPADKDGKPTVDQIVIDSATDEGKQQTAAYLNKPIVTVKLDKLGNLVSATAVSGTADRLSAELPFRIALPAQAMAPGLTWDRPFTITLAPPLGTGEKHDAVQTYTNKGVTDGVLTVGLTTALKAVPADTAQLPPLVPLLWEGEALFDTKAGRFIGSKLAVKRDVPNHQGAGTRFVFESAFTETLAK